METIIRSLWCIIFLRYSLKFSEIVIFKELWWYCHDSEFTNSWIASFQTEIPVFKLQSLSCIQERLTISMFVTHLCFETMHTKWTFMFIVFLLISLWVLWWRKTVLFVLIKLRCSAWLETDDGGLQTEHFRKGTSLVCCVGSRSPCYALQVNRGEPIWGLVSLPQGICGKRWMWCSHSSIDLTGVRWKMRLRYNKMATPG